MPCQHLAGHSSVRMAGAGLASFTVSRSAQHRVDTESQYRDYCVRIDSRQAKPIENFGVPFWPG